MADILDFKTGECIERGAPLPIDIDGETAKIADFFRHRKAHAMQTLKKPEHDADEFAYIAAVVEFGREAVYRVIEKFSQRAKNHE